jgi:hypothetical protein
VLPADVDRDVVALQPRAGGVSDLAMLPRGMAESIDLLSGFGARTSS